MDGPNSPYRVANLVAGEALFLVLQGWVRLEKLERCGEDRGYALRWGEVTAAFDDRHRGTSDEVVHRFADRGWNQDIFASPNEERWLADAGEAEVEQVAAAGHGVDAAGDDPGSSLKLLDGRLRDESGQGLGKRLEHLGEMSEAGTVYGGEKRGVEGGWEVDAGTVVEDESVDEVGMIEGELRGDPTAHGPASDVGLGDADGPHEVRDELRLRGDGIVDIRGRRTAIAEEVWNIEMEAVGGQRRQ